MGKPSSYVSVVLLGVLGSAVPAAALAQDTPPSACTQDAECELGAVCDAGACVAACTDRALPVVYFTYDESAIGTDQEPVIAALALCLRAWREDSVEIQGHTDHYWLNHEGEWERRSDAYAMALGERVARSLRTALIGVGIAEEVVEIAEDFLVGADQEHAEVVGLVG
jgi:outer membrane protein OmpA-like peptidoglycan-associated protein